MAAYYTFEDLSGGTPDNAKTDNPYHDLIISCNNDPAEIQKRYHNHRTNRNAQQKDKLLAPDFPGVTTDQILAKLENPQQNPGYADPRHCLVFWARPTEKVKTIISEVQQALKAAAPHLWLMPPSSLHMTALEVVHSLTEAEVATRVEQMRPHAESITDWTATHTCRLVQPLVSFDAQAVAVSWLPAAGEGARADEYTYHHLRRDLFELASATGVAVASRYVIPSAHLTVGRFLDRTDFEGAEGSVDAEKVVRLVEEIERINAVLREKYWPEEGGGIRAGGEWVVGDEKGLDFRKGTLWYGGGETVRLGRGA